VAAEPAVINAAIEGMIIAEKLAKISETKGFRRQSRPWLMVSLNDGEDPHFRKAEFNPAQCPPTCPRPCESICPAQAIAYLGVIAHRCYGCGRCLPICPLGLIVTHSHVSTPEAIIPLIAQGKIESIEIHTQVGHYQDFKRLWQAIAPWHDQLKLLAISCPDHADVITYLKELYQVISPLSCALIWQTDGRPMSGDIGKGTTHAAIKMAQKVLASDLPGFVQLAGGTNGHTLTKLGQLGLLKQEQKLNAQGDKSSSGTISGIAYGSYARSLLLESLKQLEIKNQPLESCPELLWGTVNQAYSLVNPLKSLTVKETILTKT
jgi:Fe-S-cluster-containing hydrogenase component 2